MFKIGDRVRVKILKNIIPEYWNVTGRIIENDLVFVAPDDMYVNQLAVMFDFAPFDDDFLGPHYFTERELISAAEKESTQ